MTTEYYQIPSQQGLLPLESSSADPWLASATSALSLNDNTWSIKHNTSNTTNPPSLFDAGDAEADAWNTLISAKVTKVPKLFNSTTSMIDAWSVVSTSPVTTLKQSKKTIIAAVPTPTPAPALVPAAINSPKVEQIEDEISGQNRYKTELCKSFNETGACRYGTKCQFAHGREEVRSVLRHPKYKTETCKTFHTTGTCPYGIRCRFIHTKSKEESIIIKPTIEVVEEDIDDDTFVSVAAPPPGIPVAKWSKSWNMAVGSPVMQRKVKPTF